MSKKLIAVASAAALALTGLVGIAPANASGPAVAFSGATGAGTSAASPATITVPHTNALATSGTVTVATVTVSNLATGDVVRVDATGSVKLVEATFANNVLVDVTTLGKSSISKTRTTDDDLVLYAYTTTTTAGTVVMNVTRTGLTATSTLHLKGVAGPEFKITNVTGVPSTLATAATAAVTFKATDVFGNAVEDDTEIKALTPTNFGAVTWDAAAKVYKATLTSPGNTAFITTIDLGATEVDGFADATDVFSAVVNNPAATGQIATLTAQVASLTAQLADSRSKATSVTKKRYNTLARKWNRAFPSQAVKLKK